MRMPSRRFLWMRLQKYMKEVKMREILFNDGQGIRFVCERQAGMYILTTPHA